MKNLRTSDRRHWAGGMQRQLFASVFSVMVLQVKAVLMAVYFAADHVVWANQAGIYNNKESVDRCAPQCRHLPAQSQLYLMAMGQDIGISNTHRHNWSLSRARWELLQEYWQHTGIPFRLIEKHHTTMHGWVAAHWYLPWS